MLSHIGHPFFVALFTGIVWIVFKPVATAGRVTGYTMKITFFSTFIHHPAGVGVVFAKVAAIGVKVGVVEYGQIVIVEIPVAGHITGSDGPHFGVAGRTRPVVLFRRKSIG